MVFGFWTFEPTTRKSIRNPGTYLHPLRADDDDRDETRACHASFRHCENKSYVKLRTWIKLMVARLTLISRLKDTASTSQSSNTIWKKWFMIHEFEHHFCKSDVHISHSVVHLAYFFSHYISHMLFKVIRPVISLWSLFTHVVNKFRWEYAYRYPMHIWAHNNK